jgi:hypothetical protein
MGKESKQARKMKRWEKSKDLHRKKEEIKTNLGLCLCFVVLGVGSLLVVGAGGGFGFRVL